MAQPPVGSSTETEFSLRRWIAGRRRLLMVVALIAAVVLLGVLQRVPLGFDPEAGERIFPDLSAIEVQAINLYDPNASTVMTLSLGTDGRWMEEGTGTVVDPQAVNRLAQTIVMLAYTQVTPLEADDDLAAYGFAPSGRLYVEFIELDGTNHAVAFGDLLPERDDGYYALVDDRQELYVIPRGAADFLISQLPTSPVVSVTESLSNTP